MRIAPLAIAYRHASPQVIHSAVVDALVCTHVHPAGTCMPNQVCSQVYQLSTLWPLMSLLPGVDRIYSMPASSCSNKDPNLPHIPRHRRQLLISSPHRPLQVSTARTSKRWRWRGCCRCRTPLQRSPSSCCSTCTGWQSPRRCGTSWRGCRPHWQAWCGAVQHCVCAGSMSVCNPPACALTVQHPRCTAAACLWQGLGHEAEVHML